MKEKEKMIQGLDYDSNDKELVELRQKAQSLIAQINTESSSDKRNTLFQDLLKTNNSTFSITAPFYCDYGFNISLGKNFYANFGCTILDVSPVTIGDNVKFGPNVHLYTATHSLNAEKRSTSIEASKPITIKDDVWLGGGVIINPGVTIGHRAVIGSGSVVTKDIPDDALAYGNPCKVTSIIKQ